MCGAEAGAGDGGRGGLQVRRRGGGCLPEPETMKVEGGVSGETKVCCVVVKVKGGVGRGRERSISEFSTTTVSGSAGGAEIYSRRSINLSGRITWYTHRNQGPLEPSRSLLNVHTLSDVAGGCGGSRGGRWGGRSGRG